MTDGTAPLYPDLAPAQPRLPQLDALRALAAILVVLFHCNVAFGGLAMFRHAQIAVDFFFMLSGFVLSAPVERTCRTIAGGGEFLVRRIARLWPVMALGSLAGFAVICADRGGVTTELASLSLALLFIPSATFGEPIFPLDGPQWSLMLELIANAVHAFVLWRLRTPLLFTVAGLSWLALALLAYAKGDIVYGPMYPGWQLGVLRIGYAYALGCVIGRYASRIAAAGRAPWWLPGLALFILLVAPAPSGMADGWRDVLALLAFGPLLTISLSASPPEMLRKPMMSAGAASWPLYALHLPLIHAAQAIAARGWLPAHIVAPLAVFLAVVLAWLVASSRIARGFAVPDRPWRRPRIARLASA